MNKLTIAAILAITTDASYPMGYVPRVGYDQVHQKLAQNIMGDGNYINSYKSQRKALKYGQKLAPKSDYKVKDDRATYADYDNQYDQDYDAWMDYAYGPMYERYDETHYDSCTGTKYEVPKYGYQQPEYHESEYVQPHYEEPHHLKYGDQYYEKKYYKDAEYLYDYNGKHSYAPKYEQSYAPESDYKRGYEGPTY